jgi:hypothetical protein
MMIPTAAWFMSSIEHSTVSFVEPTAVLFGLLGDLDQFILAAELHKVYAYLSHIFVAALFYDGRIYSISDVGGLCCKINQGAVAFIVI